MFKETIICIIIIVTILSLDIMTQKYTKNVTNEITKMLENLEQKITQNNSENIQEDSSKLKKEWDLYHKKLAYYIEHDELEKVDNAIVTMNSYIETKEYSDAKAEIAEVKFVLKHIQQKNILTLENIF